MAAVGWEAPGAISGRGVRDGTCTIDLSGARLAVTSLAIGGVRIRWSGTGEFTPPRSWSFLDEDALAASGDMTMSSEHGVVRIDDDALVVSVQGGGRIVVGERVYGRTLADACVTWNPQTGCARWTAAMPSGRHHYGLGERTGLLDHTARKLTCWTTDRNEGQGPPTDELYVAVPFLLSLERDGLAHGLLLGSTWRSMFDLTDVRGEESVLEVAGGELDLFILTGPTPG